MTLLQRMVVRKLVVLVLLFLPCTSLADTYAWKRPTQRENGEAITKAEKLTYTVVYTNTETGTETAVDVDKTELVIDLPEGSYTVYVVCTDENGLISRKSYLKRFYHPPKRVIGTKIIKDVN